MKRKEKKRKEKMEMELLYRSSLKRIVVAWCDNTTATSWVRDFKGEEKGEPHTREEDRQR